MKRILVILVVLCLATAAFGAWSTLGKAKYTPNTVTRLSDAPDTGVAMPNGTRAIEFSVKTNPIHYYTTGDNPTATDGLVLNPGTYWYDDMNWIRNVRFIDTSAGAAVVEVEWRKVQ